MKPRLALLVLALLMAGCGGSSMKEERIRIPGTEPLAEPVSILQRYAEGQPPGSEVDTFPDLVKAVREVDAAKADVLEKGFAEVNALSGAARQAKAKSVLQQLDAGAQR